MEPLTYLVFGDLHGRILPAFRLATVWAREHACPVAGFLQVGDLGYYPDPTRLDKATIRHAQKDSLELGTLDIMEPNPLADAVFEDPDCPPGMWFTSGNHEDFDALGRLSQASGRQRDFVVDAYGRVRGIKDGAIAELPGNLSVGALWGVDGEGLNHRTNLPKAGYIAQRSADELLIAPFEVLLTHDAPRDAKRTGYGSEIILSLIHLAQPRFAFFGHYKGRGQQIEQDYGRTRVYHLSGMELWGEGSSAEPGSVGILSWNNDAPEFEYVDDKWLKTFTRHNWKFR